MSITSSKMARRSSGVVGCLFLLEAVGFTGVPGGEKMDRGLTAGATTFVGEVIRAGFQGPSWVRDWVAGSDRESILDTYEKYVCSPDARGLRGGGW